MPALFLIPKFTACLNLLFDKKFLTHDPLTLLTFSRALSADKVESSR